MFQKEKNIKSNKFGNRTVLTILNFIAIFGLGLSIPAHFVLAERNLMASISPNELTTLINRERLNNGLPVLAQSNLLQRAAELKANDMIKRGYFSHNTPDGKLPWYWLNQLGYKYTTAGENLMTNIFESRQAVKAWMNSPEHRENILSKEFTQVGTAVVQGVFEGNETVFAVQFFGKPETVSSVPQISTESKTVAVSTVTKIRSEPKTVAVAPKKVAKIEKKKIISSPDPVLALETPTVNQFTRMYYTYDNGIECIVA